MQLNPGDEIYLYTDGITEQPNAAGVLYGEDRLLKTLAGGAGLKCGALGDRALPLEKGDALHQKPLLDAVIADVRRHAAGTEQADDCTQLVMRYRGSPTVFTREYEPTIKGIAAAADDLAATLESVPEADKARLMVAADEIFANIMRYSEAKRWSLTVERTHCPEGVWLVIADDGKPFDPLALRDPDTTLCAKDREVGGLGILIVKKTMSPVTYKRRNGQNILTMGKDYGNKDNN